MSHLAQSYVAEIFSLIKSPEVLSESALQHPNILIAFDSFHQIFDNKIFQLHYEIQHK